LPPRRCVAFTGLGRDSIRRLRRLGDIEMNGMKPKDWVYFVAPAIFLVVWENFAHWFVFK
jgi:hypothetical protein